MEALRSITERPFKVPGAGPEAPLSHLVLHAEDIHRPLGTGCTADPDAANVVLDQLMGPRAERLVGDLLDGVALVSTDSDWRYGDGAPVEATASALLTTLGGRTAALDELRGEGADVVRARVRARTRTAA